MISASLSFTALCCSVCCSEVVQGSQVEGFIEMKLWFCVGWLAIYWLLAGLGYEMVDGDDIHRITLAICILLVVN